MFSLLNICQLTDRPVDRSIWNAVSSISIFLVRIRFQHFKRAFESSAWKSFVTGFCAFCVLSHIGTNVWSQNTITANWLAIRLPQDGTPPSADFQVSNKANFQNRSRKKFSPKLLASSWLCWSIRTEIDAWSIMQICQATRLSGYEACASLREDDQVTNSDRQRAPQIKQTNKNIVHDSCTSESILKRRSSSAMYGRSLVVFCASLFCLFISQQFKEAEVCRSSLAVTWSAELIFKICI